MVLRWWGLGLCVGLAGCVGLNPSYTETGTEGGSEGRTSTSVSTSETRGESQSSGRPDTSPESTTGNETADTSGTNGSNETLSGPQSASETGPEPVECAPQGPCGPNMEDCPAGFSCHVYRDPASNSLAAGCFEDGEAQRGESCGRVCEDDDVPRCDAGLVCTWWREDPVCRTRCFTSLECRDAEVCNKPEDSVPANGACEPCDLLEQDCDIGETCVPGDSSTICVPGGGDGSDMGESCVQSSDCVAGLVCAESQGCMNSDAGCCLLLCDQSAKPQTCSCEGLDIPLQPNAGFCTFP
jgi:hypothetical protein